MATSPGCIHDPRQALRVDADREERDPHTRAARRDTALDLRRSKELLSATIAHAADTLLLLDTTLHIRFVSKPWKGIAPERWVGEPLEALLPESARDGVRTALEGLLRGGAPITIEYADASDPERPASFESRAILLQPPGRRLGLCVAIRDITDVKHLERKILDVTDRERQRIGLDLHDGLGQELTGIALMLRGLASRVRPAERRAIDEIIGLVNQSLDSARALANGLLPVSEASGGLIVALRRLAYRGRERYGIDVDFYADAWPVLGVNEVQASHLYRIAQEALTNVARHSRASAVQVVLNVAPHTYSLKIADNGCGLGGARSGGIGLGLRIMAYRAEVIGATLLIDDNTPRGTLIRVQGEYPHAVSGV